MSISSEISRLQGLRDRLKNKLIGLGLIISRDADLEDCAEAVESIAGTLDIADTSTHDVAGKQYARVSDANLSPGNIVSGVSILGVVGTANVQPPQANLTQGTMEYGGAAAPSTMTPPTGYDGFSSVVPQLALSPTLLPGNIKSGVNIMGVTGTMEGWNRYGVYVMADNTASLKIPILDYVQPTDWTSYESFQMYVDFLGEMFVDVTERVVASIDGQVNSFGATILSANPCYISRTGNITTQFTQDGGIIVTVNDNNTLFKGQYRARIYWR